MINVLLGIIIVELLVMFTMGVVAWRKVKVYLTWNTRYQTSEYEQAIQTPKFKKPSLPAKKLKQKGRTVKNQDDLVDITDLDFDTGFKALEDIANEN